MIAYLYVALGSAAGGVARYGFGLMAGRLWGESFPWGTIAINILGSFVIGFFGALTMPEGALPASQNLRIFVMVGICGGFTTFSSFSLQTFSLARDGSWFGAMGNVLLSVTACLMAVTLGHYAAERIGTAREASIMSTRVLAVLDRPQTAQPVLAAASLVAARMGGARIDALHLRHHALEGFMPTEDVMTDHREQEIEGATARKSAALHAIFDTWQRHGGSGAWREVVGEAAKVVPAEAAGADLVVIGNGGGQPSGDSRQAIHASLFDARLATLIVPEAAPSSIGRHVAIAWKPSKAAGRAVEAALKLLRAEQFTILAETEDGEHATEPATLPALLQQSGIPVATHRFQARGRQVGDALLEEARAVGADVLVMGAYTHSRLAELLLGGATREVLAVADLPVLMHH